MEYDIKKEIKKIAKNNKDGFTVYVDYVPHKKLLIENVDRPEVNKDIYRYCISITNNNTKNKIDKFLNDLNKYFYKGYIGGWYNPKTDRYYIDKTVITSNLEYALQLAKEHNQISIYDLKRNKVIGVKL